MRQIGHDPGEGNTPQAWLRAGDYRQLIPEHLEIASQDRFIYVNQERLRPANYNLGAG